MYNEEEDMNDFYSEDNLNRVEDLSDDTSEESIVQEKHTATVGDVTVDTETGEVLEEKNNLDEGEEEVEPKTYSVSLKDMGMGEVEVEGEDSNNSDVLSPEERLRVFADSIMSCCIGDKDIRSYALDRLMLVAKPELFRDENYIIFSIFYVNRSKLKRIDIDEEFLKLILNRNRNILQEARGYIDINAYGEVDGSVELGYIGGVIKHFKRLRSMEELSEREFETYFEKYLIEFKAIEAEKAYNQASMILSEGLTLGRKRYFGFEDSTNFLKRRLADIEGLVDMQKGTGFTTAREMLTNEKKVVKSEKVADFDRITALNDIFGGIYTGIFYQVIAPPKAGKTKLCCRVTHTGVVKYGTNVTVWAAEGGKELFLAQLRAIHFDYIYNTGANVTERKYGVSQDAILKDNFPSEELRQLELSSKLDFASNEDYGSIDFIDRPFEVETFIDDIDTSVKSNNSKMVVVDYLQLMGSANNVESRTAISRAYVKLLAYCKTNNIAVFCPGQYKQEVIDRLMATTDTSKAEMRTAGGSSSEVIRTPDIIFALWASTEDLRNNTAKILSVPCRLNKPFPEINLVTDLETCQFISVDK